MEFQRYLLISLKVNLLEVRPLQNESFSSQLSPGVASNASNNLFLTFQVLPQMIPLFFSLHFLHLLQVSRAFFRLPTSLLAELMTNRSDFFDCSFSFSVWSLLIFDLVVLVFFASSTTLAGLLSTGLTMLLCGLPSLMHCSTSASSRGVQASGNQQSEFNEVADCVLAVN